MPRSASSTRRRIALTTCPLSNLKLCVFKRLADHNLGRLLDAGLLATVNSDDPAYFGGYLNDNFVQTFEALPALADVLTAIRLKSSVATLGEAAFANRERHLRGGVGGRVRGIKRPAGFEPAAQQHDHGHENQPATPEPPLK